MGTMETDYIKELGLVKGFSGNQLIIEKTGSDNCNACRLKTFCSLKNNLEFTITTDEDFQIGEIVDILISPKKRLYSSFIVYILPLIVMFLFFYVAHNFLNLSENIAAIISILSLTVSFSLIFLINNKQKNNDNIQIKRRHLKGED